jgi:hypothetical protein
MGQFSILTHSVSNQKKRRYNYQCKGLTFLVKKPFQQYFSSITISSLLLFFWALFFILLR